MKERTKFERDIQALWVELSAQIGEFEEGVPTSDDGAVVPVGVGAVRDRLYEARSAIERMELAGHDGWNEHSQTVATLIADLRTSARELEATIHTASGAPS